MLQGVNNAFNSAKRAAREDQFILESVLGEDDILNEMDDDMDDIVDVDSAPTEVMSKVDAALDKIIGNGIDDEEIDEMLDDDIEDEDSIDIAITEACGAWYDDEAIGHPNKAIRDGVKHQPRFMSNEGLDLSCDTEDEFDNF